MPKNAKKYAYKEKEFQMYVLWKSLPAYFRGMKKMELHSHGFTDPLVMKVATIQSQTAFAKKFRIKDLGTLTDWNAKINKNKLDRHGSYTSFKKQVLAVNKGLSTLPDIALKQALCEQRKVISILKKENKSLTKRLSTNTPKNPIHIKLEPTPIIQPIIIPPEPQIIESAKALSFFKKMK